MIEVNALAKDYGKGKGVFDLTFSIKEGEVFGYLGPNGAGKTTTIRHLLGFVNADSGSCSIAGLDCRNQAAQIQKKLGYLPGEIAFFENMTGQQFLQLLLEMRSIKNKVRLGELVDRFNLDISRKIRRMSKGMKQKVGIIAAFMHDPAVYILDEPTSGLDPLMQSTFIDLITEEKSRGKTIMMSSHSFDEIDRTCDRAGIVREGRLVAVEDVHSLKESQRRFFAVTVAGESDAAHLQNGGLSVSNQSGLRFEIVVTGNYAQLFSVLSGCNIKSFEAVNQSLEQVFMKYYGQGGEIK